MILDHELKVRRDKAYVRKFGTRRSIDTIEKTAKDNEAFIRNVDTENSIMLNCEPGVVLSPIKIAQTNNGNDSDAQQVVEDFAEAYEGFKTYRTCSIKKENLIENTPTMKYNYSNEATPKPEVE